MHKYLTIHILKESFKRYWINEDLFGRLLCLPALILSVPVSLTVGLFVDFVIKTNGEK